MKQRTAAALAAAVLAGLTLAPLPASAQTPSAAPDASAPIRPRDRMPANDADFVRALELLNTAELATAKYLVNRTTDPVVHAFAQRMIDDHSTAAVQLEAATRGTNMAPVPREQDTNPLSARGLTTLQSEDGAERDGDYMRMQVAAHHRMMELLRWEAENGTNAGLKMLAANLTGPMQQHLQLVQAYLAAHNLTPDGPPMPGAGMTRAGTPNNPGSTSNGGSTAGQNNGTAPSPVPSASPHA